MVYDDPKESWDNAMEKILLEEINNSKFNNFVEVPSVPPLFCKLFNSVDEEGE